MPDQHKLDLSFAELIIELGYRLMAGIGTLWDGGPTMNPNEALKIVDNPSRLQAARSYWTGVLSAWISDLSRLESAPPPGIAFALAASNNSLLATIDSRIALHQSEILDDVFLHDYRCMVALDEIAAFVAQLSSFSGTELLSIMRQTLLGQTGSLSRELQALGVQAARQVHELLLRFDYTSRMSVLVSPLVASGNRSIPFTEMMALYRLEGNFCCTPPERSFPNGPLTLTMEGTCREPNVFRTTDTTLTNDALSRPGWIMIRQADVAMDHKDESYRLTLTEENLNWLGGLDAITSWPLPLGDELRALAETHAASNISPVVDLTRRNRLSTSYKPSFDRLVETLWMSSIETQADLPAVSASLEAAYTQINQLLQMHKPRGIPDSATARKLALLGDDYGNSTFITLTVAARWYQSRTNPATLLAWRDRSRAVQMPRFGPYTAYLRYHLGDVLFMGILIRLLKDMRSLSTQWESDSTKESKKEWKNAVPASSWLPSLLNTAGWTQAHADSLTTTIQSALDFWKQPAVYYNPPHIADTRFPTGELIWRTVGIQNRWKNAGGVPSWFPSNASPPAKAVEAANTARTVIQLISDNGLFPAIESALEYSLQTRLFALPSLSERINLKKHFSVAENSRRLQLYLEATRALAGLDENGLPI